MPPIAAIIAIVFAAVAFAAGPALHLARDAAGAEAARATAEALAAPLRPLRATWEMALTHGGADALRALAEGAAPPAPDGGAALAISLNPAAILAASGAAPGAIPEPWRVAAADGLDAPFTVIADGVLASGFALRGPDGVIGALVATRPFAPPGVAGGWAAAAIAALVAAMAVGLFAATRLRRDRRPMEQVDAILAAAGTPGADMATPDPDAPAMVQNAARVRNGMNRLGASLDMLTLRLEDRR